MNWNKSFQLASIYVGTVVGAGFATGREIVEFFSKYGLFGLIGILIAGILFIGFGVKVMTLAIRLKAKSFDQLNEYLFGPFVTPVINAVLFIMLIGVTSVMLSGAGSVFQEQLQLSKTGGILFTIGLALFVLVIGTKGLVIVNTIVVPLLFSFTFILAVLAFQLDEFWTNVQAYQSVQVNFIMSAFAYAAFNITLATAVLVPAVLEIGNERIVRMGGIIGGVILTFILIASHITLVQLPNLVNYQIPIANLMYKMAGSLYFLYILVIYGEIFTSIVGNIYGLERYVRKKIQVHPLIIGGVILTVAFFISQIEYGVLLGALYPLFGYISLVFLLLLLFK